MGTDNLTPIQQVAYDLVAEIIEAKQNVVEPCAAHINEIRNSLNVELLEALRELCRREVLAARLDINKNPMFTIKEPIQ